VPKRLTSITVLLAVGIWATALPSRGQALLPYSIQLDNQVLEEQGLRLGQDAVRLLRFGRNEPALARALLASQLAPRRFQSWFILGSVYVQQRQFDQAIAALQRAKTLAPNEAPILFTLGSARFQTGDYQGAIAELSAGLELRPEAVDAWFDLGNAYLMRKQYPEAINSYERAYSLERNFWPALTNIGLVLYEQGNVSGAIERWQASVAIDRDAVEPQIAIAIALYSRGEQERGITLGTSALKSDPRYAELDFLRQNLWGDKLINDARQFLSLPAIRTAIRQAQRGTNQAIP